MDEHEDQAVEVNPELNDVLQLDDPGPAVLVRADGPVEVRQLPSRRAELFTLDLADLSAQTVFGRDLRRARVVLIAQTQAVRLSVRRNGIATGFRLPVGQQFELLNTEALYAAADVAGAVLHVLTEYWAD